MHEEGSGAKHHAELLYGMVEILMHQDLRQENASGRVCAMTNGRSREVPMG